MADTLKPVVIVVACAYGDVGHEFTPNGTTRDWLVAMGYAKVVEAADPERAVRFSAKAAQKIAAATKSLLG